MFGANSAQNNFADWMNTNLLNDSDMMGLKFRIL